MGAPSRVIISPRLLLRVFPSAIVSFNKLISWDLESLFSRIKLQTPVWRCSGYPDEMEFDNIME